MCLCDRHRLLVSITHFVTERNGFIKNKKPFCEFFISDSINNNKSKKLRNLFKIVYKFPSYFLQRQKCSL